MAITLNLQPELEAALLAHAQEAGAAPEDYLQHLVERDLSAALVDSGPSDEAGMVWEDGLYIYGAGTALPEGSLDSALRRSRERRAQHLLCHRLWSGSSTLRS
jgi:hypothetical protein